MLVFSIYWLKVILFRLRPTFYHIQILILSGKHHSKKKVPCMYDTALISMSGQGLCCWLTALATVDYRGVIIIKGNLETLDHRHVREFQILLK